MSKKYDHTKMVSEIEGRREGMNKSFLRAALILGMYITLSLMDIFGSNQVPDVTNNLIISLICAFIAE